MEQIEKIFQELRKEVITVQQAEKQVLDLFAVSGSLEYKKGYDDATKEAEDEIAEYYNPNDR